MQESFAFQVFYECGNCGKEWKCNYPEGTRVLNTSILRNSPRVRCENDTLGHETSDCDICEIEIECPNCQIADTVSVIDRVPLQA